MTAMDIHVPGRDVFHYATNLDNQSGGSSLNETPRNLGFERRQWAGNTLSSSFSWGNHAAFWLAAAARSKRLVFSRAPHSVAAAHNYFPLSLPVCLLSLSPHPCLVSAITADIAKGKANWDGCNCPLAAAQVLGARLDARLPPAHVHWWSGLALCFLLYLAVIMAADLEATAMNFLIKKEMRSAAPHRRL